MRDRIFLNANLLPPRLSTEDYPPGKILGDFFCVGNKSSGVEPGFLGIIINQDFVDRLQHTLSAAKEFSTENADYLQSVLSQLKNPVDCRKFLLELEAVKEKSPAQKNMSSVLERLANQLQIEGKTGRASEEKQKCLDLWLVKQDYEDPEVRRKDTPGWLATAMFVNRSLADYVAPPLKNLRQTTAIQNLPVLSQEIAAQFYYVRRLKPRTEENMNAIRECIASEIAKASGMDAQEQELVLGRYADGVKKIMTAARWQPGLEMLEGSFAGSKKGKYENYLVEVKMHEQGQPELISDIHGYLRADSSMRNLGENLPFLIAQGDRDFWGSKFQNKGRITVQDEKNAPQRRLFGFDFGHSYEVENKILNSVDLDFGFVQPALDTLTDSDQIFKNVTAFYDTPLSERMMGMFYLFKMSDQKTLEKIFTSEELAKVLSTIEEYKKANADFARRYSLVEQGGLLKIFDKYQKKIDELYEPLIGPKDRAEKLWYQKKIQESQAIALQSHAFLLDKFKSRMQLSPQEIDVVNHLELITATTDRYSADGVVQLNHLRVVNNSKRLRWHITRDGDDLVFKPTGSTLDNDFKKVTEYLHQHMPQLIVREDSANEGYGFSIKRDQLHILSAALSEKNLIHLHHGKTLNRVQESKESIANIPASLNFSELKEKKRGITGGAHAGAAKRAGQYLHGELGRLFVKQDTRQEKNLVEWVFYQVAKNLFSLSGQHDILARMAPIVLVTPDEKTRQPLKEIYVGSIAHENMQLAWQDVYRRANPGKELPASRPGGFESFNSQAIHRYVQDFAKHDEGFSMLPMFEILGHYATHLGNLGLDGEKMVFFDYGAAAWYDLHRKQFDDPSIQAQSLFFSLVGQTKHYIELYSPEVFDDRALKRLQAAHDLVHNQEKQSALLNGIVQAMEELNKLVDDNGLRAFAKYIGMKNIPEPGLTTADLPNQIGRYLCDCIVTRLSYIPSYVDKNYGSDLTAKLKIEPQAQSVPENKTSRLR